MRISSRWSFWLLMLALAWPAEAQPFAFEGSTAALAWQGKRVVLETLEGQAPVSGLILHRGERAQAAAVLWLDSGSGKEGRVRVYLLPSGKRIWESPPFLSPDLQPAPATARFVVTVPLNELNLAPPRLRLRHQFRWSELYVGERHATLDEPATPAQGLEWANYELAERRPASALRGLDDWDRRYGSQAELAAERAIGLDLRARALAQLGRGQETVAVLGRLARDFATEPQGLAAQDALAFIQARSLGEYLQRERDAAGR